MKTKAPLLLAACALALALALASGGCATRTTASGGKETTVLGGALTVATNSFQPTTPATADADTTKLIGHGNPSGAKTTLLWGLITLHDY
jgi:ABC-type oligopeptide transport system substrate-binding subunit